ncbi:MAG TPA: sigma 54-interacting transcriptional regulator [Syntrophothermus lipocalidus]|nr:sigma 54-interacting transcriptional regulator [Syntrophothermus lipocalidus]
MKTRRVGKGAMVDTSRLPGIDKKHRVSMKDLLSTIDGQVGVYFTDGAAFTLGVSRAYEELTQIAEEEVINRHMRELEEAKFIDKSVTLLVLKNKAPLTIQQKILRSKKKVIVTGNPVFNQEGEILLVATTVCPTNEKNEFLATLESTPHVLSAIENMVATSKAMQRVLLRAIRAAATDSTVLLIGESGVGKEVVARVIHQSSQRRSKAFVKVNVASLPDELIESELFGYQPGAFTGATKSGKVGLAKAADGGTLFLDEISEIPLSSQAKLLRLLQEKEFIPIGGVTSTRVDVRFIAATNKNLEEMVEKGEFRQDLYYRLNVIPIHIPPLRERKEDIHPLAEMFLDKFRRRFSIDKKLCPSGLQALLDHNWPGNVRELENLLERLVVLYPQSKITRELVENELGTRCVKTRNGSFQVSSTVIKEKKDLSHAVDSFEKQLIEQTLRQCNFDLRKTAKALGIHRTTLLRKMRKYGIN